MEVTRFNIELFQLAFEICRTWLILLAKAWGDSSARMGFALDFSLLDLRLYLSGEIKKALIKSKKIKYEQFSTR